MTSETSRGTSEPSGKLKRGSRHYIKPLQNKMILNLLFSHKIFSNTPTSLRPFTVRTKQRMSRG